MMVQTCTENETDDEQDLRKLSLRHLGAAQALARSAVDLLDADDPSQTDLDIAGSLLGSAMTNSDRARAALYRAEKIRKLTADFGGDER